MKSVSILALATAMALSLSVPTFAQTVGGTVDATTDTSGSVNVGDTTVDVDADAEVDAGADVDSETDTGTDAELDTDGDGTVSEEERTAGTNSGTLGNSSEDDEQGACPAPEYTSAADVSVEDMAVLSAAVTAQFILVEDCDTGGSLVGGSSGTDSDIDAAVFANHSLAAEASARGIGEIFGISIDGDAVTIYAEENEGDDDTAGENAGAVTSGSPSSGTNAGVETDAATEVDAGVETSTTVQTQ